MMWMYAMGKLLGIQPRIPIRVARVTRRERTVVVVV